MFKIRFSKTFLNEIIGTVTYLKYVITKIKKVVLFFKFEYVLMFKPCNFTKDLFYKLTLFYKFYSTTISVFVRALFRISCVQAAFV